MNIRSKMKKYNPAIYFCMYAENCFSYLRYQYMMFVLLISFIFIEENCIEKSLVHLCYIDINTYT